MARNIKAATLRQVVNAYAGTHPEEVARRLDGRSGPVLLSVFHSLAPETATNVMGRLSPASIAAVVERMDRASTKTLAPRLNVTTLVRLLPGLSPAAQKRVRGVLPATVIETVDHLAEFPEGSAARLADCRPLVLPGDLTVAAARERWREVHRDDVSQFYLVDAEGDYLGAVGLAQLVRSEAETLLRDLPRLPLEAAPATASREELIEILDRSPASALPVIDLQGRLFGEIRNEALVESAEEEASADVQSMSGAGKEEKALSPIGYAVKSRLAWVNLRLLWALPAAFVVQIFEDSIARVTALAVLLPLIAATSSQAGAQSLAVVMRALGLEEISLKQWKRIAFKEAVVGLLNGIAVGVVAGVAIWVWLGSSRLALAAAAALPPAMLVAGVIGACAPLLLERFGHDPARASSILVRGATDITGIGVFLGIAAWLV